MRRALLLFVLLINYFCISGKTVRITNQSQFDAAVEQINKGKAMRIALKKGIYLLKYCIKSNAPLYISGNNATITHYDNVFSRKDALSNDEFFWKISIKDTITPYSLFYNNDGELLKVSESIDEKLGVNLSDDDIISGVELQAGSLIKIPIPENLNHLRNRLFIKAFGFFDCGWQIVKFLLLKSDDGYFYCQTLELCRTGNYNYDKRVYKKAVRFVIYNAEKRKGSIYYDDEFLYVPKSINCVYQINCTNYISTEPDIVINSNFIIKDVRFCGFRGIEVKSMSSSVCEITKCIFQNCLGCPLKIDRRKDKEVKEAIIKDCTFSDCSLVKDHVLTLSAPSDDLNYSIVSSCSVTRYSKAWVTYKNPDGGIWVNGNTVLEGNVVYNQPRCHLYFNRGKIVAEGNILFNTDSFNEHADRNLSSDWGLVYCNHIFKETEEALNNVNHHVLIKNNLLYGAIAYGCNARGIFIDDGRGDIACVGNIVLNTQLYSIDARNSNITEASSVRNSYERNIVTTHYRLASGNQVKGDDMPTTKGNHMVTSQKNIVSNANVSEEDVLLDEVDTTARCIGRRVYVSKSLFKELKKSPAWKSVKTFIKRYPQY